MNLLNSIVVGLKDIWAHRFRSVLTMLGIILGVASLVGMTAIVKGMENGLKEAMIAMGGADKVSLEAQAVPPYQEHLADEAPGRTMLDVVALRAGAPLIRLVSPEMALNNCTLTQGTNMVNPSECVGVWPAVLDMNLHTLQYGRFFNEINEEKAAAVCVIGTGIRDELFGPRRICRPGGLLRPRGCAGPGLAHPERACHYAYGHASGGVLQRRGWDCCRLVPGLQSRQARSDPGAAVRTEDAPGLEVV
jgi:hypothetical protein